MRKYFLLFILICFVFTPAQYLFGANTTGFIPGQIWYSKDSFVESETVKIYTAIWNNSASALSAKVEFYDKNVILGSRDVLIGASSLKEVSISWKVTSGDHLISAKIISPSISNGGKKESVTLSNSVTEVDKRFIPIVINTVEGKPATSSDIVKSQVEKVTSSVTDAIPDSISEPTMESMGALDDFRANTLKTISSAKIETQQELKELNKNTDSNSKNINTNSSIEKSTKTPTVKPKTDVVDATEKPIAYLKLFFLSILSFIFGSKIIFYFVVFLVVFFVIRFVYNKIRNR